MVIDASVWVSGILRRDTHHAESREWLNQRLAARDTLVIPTVALAEVAGAISRRTGVVALGHRSVEQVVNAPGLRLVPLDSELGAEAAEVAANLQLRGTDAVYVAVAHSMGIPLVTWDQEMRIRSSGYVEVIQPVLPSRPPQ